MRCNTTVVTAILLAPNMGHKEKSWKDYRREKLLVNILA